MDLVVAQLGADQQLDGVEGEQLRVRGDAVFLLDDGLELLHQPVALDLARGNAAGKGEKGAKRDEPKVSATGGARRWRE